MLSVIWATGTDFKVDWESSWILDLLDGIDFTIRNVAHINDIVPNALIVMNHNIPYGQYLRAYENARVPFGLIHLSDEYINDDIGPYSFQMCMFVFRNYYRAIPEGLRNKVTFFGLGYKYGFWNGVSAEERQQMQCKRASVRELVWSFAGGMRSNRESSFKEITKITPNKVVTEHGNSFNNVRTGLCTKDYRELMCNSKFVLCPVGNVSVDCFRVYEALECGAIPIALRKNSFQDTGVSSYWNTLMSYEPSFVMAESMDCNAQTVMKLLADVNSAELIDSIQQQCIAEWDTYKKELRLKLKNAVVQNLS
jgi:hypothetical protein